MSIFVFDCFHCVNTCSLNNFELMLEFFNIMYDPLYHTYFWQHIVLSIGDMTGRREISLTHGNNLATPTLEYANTVISVHNLTLGASCLLRLDAVSVRTLEYSCPGTYCDKKSC